MADKIKQNIVYVLCGAMGLLAFIFSAFTYADIFVKFSGYDLFGTIWDSIAEEESKAAAVATIQIFVLIVAGLMLVWGGLGLLKGLGKFEKFPDKLGSIKSTTIAKALFWILDLLVLVQIVLLFMLKADSSGVMKVGFGIFAMTICNTIAFVAAAQFDKKYSSVASDSDDDEE